jgi:ABC-type uncharacterized transport system auxiliary subunit
MRKLINKLIVLVPVLFVAGCGLLSPVQQRSVANYEIMDRTVNARGVNCTNPHSDNLIYISPMRAYPPYDLNKMYYNVESSYQINTFGYSQWVASPTELMSQELSKKVATSCVFKNLATSHALAQEMDSNNQNAAARLIVGAELVDLDSNKVIASKIFDARTPTAVGPDGYVKGINKLTEQFDQQVVDWLRQQT